MSKDQPLLVLDLSKAWSPEAREAAAEARRQGRSDRRPPIERDRANALKEHDKVQGFAFESDKSPREGERLFHHGWAMEDSLDLYGVKHDKPHYVGGTKANVAGVRMPFKNPKTGREDVLNYQEHTDKPYSLDSQGFYYGFKTARQAVEYHLKGKVDRKLRDLNR